MSLNLHKTQWKRVSFGDVVANVNRTVKDPTGAGLDRVIAMEHLDPGELKIERWGETADGTTFTRRVEPGQTLFGKRRAYQRKAALADFPAVCSGDILTFEADEQQLLPEFLPFIVQSDGFYDHALGTSAGSLSPRTNWRDLATFEFDLPSLDEQKRIAGLLWAAEGHRRSMSRARAQVALTEANWAARELSRMPSSRRLGDFARTRSGPSYGATQVHSEAASGRMPVIGITNTKSDGSFSLDEIGFVEGLADSVEAIDENSLVLVRTNGNRGRIGNVYLPPTEAHGMAVSAFQFLMKLPSQEERDIVHAYLATPVVQSAMSDAASGSTGLGNLAVRWLNELQVPWGPEDELTQFLRGRTEFATRAARLEQEFITLAALSDSIRSSVFGGAA